MSTPPRGLGAPGLGRAGLAVALGELEDVLAHQPRGAIAVLVADGLIDPSMLLEVPVAEPG